jgi:hypothetical protein
MQSNQECIFLSSTHLNYVTPSLRAEGVAIQCFVILNAVKNLDSYQWFSDPSHSLRMTIIHSGLLRHFVSRNDEREKLGFSDDKAG